MVLDIDKINKKITEKIAKGEFREEIKDFLREILIFEFEHFEEARPRYTDSYGELIDKYTKRDKETKSEEK